MDHVDPDERHAQWFLDRLQRLSDRVRTTDDDIDEILGDLNKRWPQVLAAFRWASAHRKESSVAAAISDALMACAGGDAQVEFHRSAEDFRRWAYAASDYAKKFVDQPNDAAFLFRFAGIALVESGIVKVARETRSQISDVLNVAGVLLQQKARSQIPESLKADDERKPI